MRRGGHKRRRVNDSIRAMPVDIVVNQCAEVHLAGRVVSRPWYAGRPHEISPSTGMLFVQFHFY